MVELLKAMFLNSPRLSVPSLKLLQVLANTELVTVMFSDGSSCHPAGRWS